jgi:hypothetical protein
MIALWGVFGFRTPSSVMTCTWWAFSRSSQDTDPLRSRYQYGPKISSNAVPAVKASSYNLCCMFRHEEVSNQGHVKRVSLPTPAM